MTWDDVRRLYPNRWVVVEAEEAHIENDRRVITQLNVAAVCSDPEETMRRFSELSRLDRLREYYPLHTDREELDIHVQSTFGRLRQL